MHLVTQPNLLVEEFSTGYDDADFVKKWIKLEENALEGNMFLSPHFVIPSLKYLSPNVTPHFIVVKSPNGELLALAIFKDSSDDRAYPFKHLEGYSSLHTYLQGILIDKDHAKSAVHALLSYIKNSNFKTPIKFHVLPSDGKQFGYIKEGIKEFGGQWIELYRQRRAILSLNERRQNYFMEHFNSKQRNDCNRRMKRLSEKGTVEWRIHSKPSDCKRCISDFLRLENSGWKGEKKTSLLSSSDNQHFFDEMAGNFIESKKMICTELLFNGKPISATNNYISGGTLFAFKLGWDIDFKKYSPNVLDLCEFTNYLVNNDTGYNYIDSGSSEGAFIEKIWKDHRYLVSGYLTFNLSSKLLLESAITARNCLKRLHSA